MLILASGSPRRRELLALITPDFQVVVSDADETPPPGADPAAAVEELARRKARAVAALHPGWVVIGADTVVALGGEILGKPEDEAHAAAMLRRLSGRDHAVLTGVAVCLPGGGEQIFSQRTRVRFAALSDGEIAAYVASGEPMDKAGAYGIQERGALFVEEIQGDYYNVMGLPVCRLNRALRALGAL